MFCAVQSYIHLQSHHTFANSSIGDMAFEFIPANAVVDMARRKETTLIPSQHDLDPSFVCFQWEATNTPWWEMMSDLGPYRNTLYSSFNFFGCRMTQSQHGIGCKPLASSGPKRTPENTKHDNSWKGTSQMQRNLPEACKTKVAAQTDFNLVGACLNP